MSSDKQCCVPGCKDSGGMHAVLHGFPNPEKDRLRFNTWLYSIGRDILGLENAHIFKYRRVCHRHFQHKYLCRNNRISNIAVPTLCLPDGKNNIGDDDSKVITKIIDDPQQHLDDPEEVLEEPAPSQVEQNKKIMKTFKLKQSCQKKKMNPEAIKTAFYKKKLQCAIIEKKTNILNYKIALMNHKIAFNKNKLVNYKIKVQEAKLENLRSK